MEPDYSRPGDRHTDAERRSAPFGADDDHGEVVPVARSCIPHADNDPTRAAPGAESARRRGGTGRAPSGRSVLVEGGRLD
jgi:hypothetical protein